MSTTFCMPKLTSSFSPHFSALVLDFWSLLVSRRQWERTMAAFYFLSQIHYFRFRHQLRAILASEASSAYPFASLFLSCFGAHTYSVSILLPRFISLFNLFLFPFLSFLSASLSFPSALVDSRAGGKPMSQERTLCRTGTLIAFS